MLHKVEQVQEIITLDLFKIPFRKTNMEQKSLSLVSQFGINCQVQWKETLV